MTQIEELIKEIREKLTSSKSNIVECLKKSLLVAKHFNDVDKIAWIESEILGYNTKCPEYRKINAALYQKEYGVQPLGLGQIARYQKTNIIDTLDFPYAEGIEQIEEFANQDSIKLSVFLKKEGRDVPLLFQGADFRKIVNHVNLLLMDYIEEKSTIVSQKPYAIPLMKIFNKFHTIAKLLEVRHKEKNITRSTLKLEDEYDVQDLLRSLLAINFDSVLREEYVPQFAKKRARVDFFLKFEGIAIEVKKPRDNTHANTLRDEIILDKEFYSKKKDISDLYFFIYDPASFLTDRADFVKDLEEDKSSQFRLIKIIIKPDL